MSWRELRQAKGETDEYREAKVKPSPIAMKLGGLKTDWPRTILLRLANAWREAWREWMAR